MDSMRATPTLGAIVVADENRDRFLEPVIAAVKAALGEMAATEVFVVAVHDDPAAIVHSFGDIAAVLGLMDAAKGVVSLHFTRPTALTLARRVLADSVEEVDDRLVVDCVGEIANVVAGQAKALLAGSPFQLRIALPDVVVGSSTEMNLSSAIRPAVIIFGCDAGEFAISVKDIP